MSGDRISQARDKTVLSVCPDSPLPLQDRECPLTSSTALLSGELELELSPKSRGGCQNCQPPQPDLKYSFNLALEQSLLLHVKLHSVP